MGKYMRKSKPAADVAAIEVSGVRTRAKTLALQRSSSSYLQLRSRRLEKPPLLFLAPKRPHHAPAPKKEEEMEKRDELNDDERACFGENVLSQFDQTRDRTTRESTPCSLIGDPDAIRTPGSTTRPSSSVSADTNRRLQNSSQRYIPTTHDMDEFFAGPEVEQQQQFIDKLLSLLYNFDPVNEKPLPGHYEWEKLDS